VIKPPGELIEFLFPFDPAVRSMTLGLRQVVIEELGACHELVLSMGAKLSLIYSSTERVIADGICYIGVYRKHVNLGFHRGVDLDDPHGVLRGSGKAMRHIQVKRLSHLDRPDLRVFIRLARKNAGAGRRENGGGVITRVKKTRPDNPFDS
jgi:Domain of unknown function (DU1801)